MLKLFARLRSDDDTCLEKRFKLRRPGILCSKCQIAVDHHAANDTNSGNDAETRHYDSSDALVRSAANGCQLCLRFVQNAELNPWLPRDPPRRKDGAVMHRGPTWLILTVPYTDDSTKVVDSSLIIEPAAQQGLDYDSPEPRTNTADALPLCRRWLMECRASHNGCKRSKKSVTPTRVLDISRKVPRLRLAEELEAGINYATLSHCWGTSKFLTLQKTTLAKFRRGIPPEALSKTFRDAIRIAQSLGFLYLWIDSLCIVQDSAEDWDRESSLMAQVYGGSELNIAASAAKDGSVGCFFNREKTWKLQVQSTSKPVRLFECYQSLDVVAFPGTKGGALAERAWVVQERYLPRRTLHFSEHQVLWECDDRPACELFPNGYPSGFAIQDSFLLKKNNLLLKQWPQIVEMYSKCKLTKISDKLVAIGGLAEVIQEQTNNEYVAGMWRTDLECQLCWEVRGEATAERIVPYTAPTWSWASLNKATIAYPKPEDLAKKHIFNVHINDVQMHSSSSNRFGGLSSARIRLSCSLFLRGIVKGTPHPFPMLGQIWVPPCSVSFSFGKSCEVSIAFDTVATKPELCFFLPVRRSLRDTSVLLDGVLLECGGERRDEYRRVGYFSLLEMSQDEIEMAHRDLDDFGVKTVEGSDGMKRHFIDLI